MNMKMMAGVVIALVLLLGCFVAGYFFMTPQAGVPVVAPEAPVSPAAADTPAASAAHKFNVTIETTADWTRIIVADGAFVAADPGTVRAGGMNAVELTSEAPEQVTGFRYAPNEISVNQRQFAHARIVIKGVIESSQAAVEVRLGHGDNGGVKLTTPVDTFSNEQNLGDWQNFVTRTVRLE